MTFINTIPEERAEAEVDELYRRQRGNKNYLPNYAPVFCYRPKVMDAWANLLSEIRSTMDFRCYELVTFAAALELKGSYCALAHGKVLTDRFYSQAQLENIARGSDTLELSDKDRAMMSLARQVVRDSSAITEADIDSVRQYGFNEAEIFDIVTTAAARCFFSKIPDALGVQPDSRFTEFPASLREVLVVGREIAEQSES